MTLEHLTDFDNPPDLITATMKTVLTAGDCGINAWLRYVAQGTLAGLTNGHRPQTAVSAVMREEGPLREAMMQEFAFRSASERYATRGLCTLAAIAPTVEEMEYFVTQVVDEARHAACFREHLIEMGVPPAELVATEERLIKKDHDRILAPLSAWSRAAVEDRKDYLAGVALITILLEGVLAPSAALSEIKWRPFDAVAAEIERCANTDEVRHLTICASIVREHLLRYPQDKFRLMDFVAEGFKRWQAVPVNEMMFERESLYQAGLDANRPMVGDLQIVPGLRLADSTPEQRLGIAMQWSRDMQANRLTYMGLAELVQH